MSETTATNQSRIAAHVSDMVSAVWDRASAPLRLEKDPLGHEAMALPILLSRPDNLQRTLIPPISALDREQVRLARNLIDEACAETIHVLCKKGADPNLPRGSDGSPLFLAIAQKATLPILKALLSHIDPIDQRNVVGNSALMFAAKVGNLSAMELLLDQGAEMEAKNDAGHTAFLLACSNGELSAAQWLLKHGANAHALGNAGEDALLIALRTKHEAMSTWLVEQGIMPPEKDHSPALFLAAMSGYMEVVEALLSAGWDPRKASNPQGVPLVDVADERCLPRIQSAIQALDLAENTPSPDSRVQIRF